MADGSITIDATLDNSGFEKGSAKLQSSIQRLQSKINNLGPTFDKAMTGSKSGIGSFNSKAQQLRSTISQLEQQLAQMSNTRIKTDDYSFAEKQLAKAQQQLEKYIEKQRELESSGSTAGTKKWDALAAKIEAVKAQIAEYKADLAGMEESGTAFIDAPDTAAFQSATQAIAACKAQLSGMSEEVARTAQSSGILSGVGKAASTAFRGLASAARSAASALASMAAALGRNVLSGLRSVASGAGRAAISIMGLTRNAKKSSSGMGGMLKNVLRYGLGIRSLFVLFNRLRNAIKEGLGNMAEYSSDVKNQVDSMKASLLTVKNAAASAFAPVLGIVAPIINSLCSMLATAMNYIGAFFAALTGKGSYTKAIKQTGAAIAGTGDAAGGAAKQLQDYLSPLDEINKFTEDSGGGGGGGGGGGIDPSSMFEEAEIPGFVKDWVDKLKKAWENADFTSVGRAVGVGLRDALKSIPWGNIQTQAKKVAKSLGTLINGFVSTPGLWDAIGSTIGNGLNTAIYTANEFIQTVNWSAIGYSLASGLNSVVQTVDWAALGDYLGGRLQAAIDVLHGFVHEFDWPGLGSALSTCINSISDSVDLAELGDALGTGLSGVVATMHSVITETDWDAMATDFANGVNNFTTAVNWADLGTTLSDGLKSAFDMMSTTIQTIDWNALGEGVREFLCNIDWAGIIASMFELIGSALAGITDFVLGIFGTSYETLGADLKAWWESLGEFTIQGLFDGILNICSDIGGWIEDNVATPLIDGFKSTLGIASPSKVMEENGEFTIQGLENGMTNEEGNMTETASGLAESLIGAFSNLGTSVGEKFQDARDAASNAWSNAKTLFSGVASTVSSGFDTLPTLIKGKFKGASDDSKSQWKNTKSDFTNVAKNAAGGFDNVQKLISEKFKSAYTSAKQAWDSASTYFRSVANTIGLAFSSIPGQIRSYMSSAYSAVQAMSWGNLGYYVTTGIINGMYTTAGLGNWASWFTAQVKRSLGIASPSKLMRREVGPYLGSGIAAGLVDSTGDILRAIDVITDSMVDRFDSGMAGLKFDVPVTATGTIAPPSVRASAATSTGGSDLAETLQGLVSVMSALIAAQTSGSESSGKTPFHLTGTVNGRVLFDALMGEARDIQFQTGRNPFTNLA